MQSHVEILLVEDNISDAELTMRSLKKYNSANRIYHVKDGAEALDFIFAQGNYISRQKEQLPKVIILDLKLPKVNGLEVLEKIKGDERTRATPVVIMTSSKEERDILESYKLGVNSYITKPVDFEEFTKAVNKLGCYWMLVNQAPC